MRHGFCVRPRVLSVSVGLLLTAALCSPAAWAQAPDPQAMRAEVERLRQEFEAIRKQYDARLADLETRIGTLEGKPAAPVQTPAPPAAAAPPAPTQVDVPPGAAGAGGPTGALPIYGSASALSKIFNPDIAVIGNFVGAAGRNEINPAPALQLEEAEASFQAIVDPYARADFFVAFGPEGAEIEEGFLTFPALPGGLLMKVGKMKAQFGKVNTLHAHALPWTDRPLVMQNLLGGEEGISDSGISVSKLLLNPWFFLEATGEVYLGDSAVFTSHKRGNLSYVGRLRGYGDVTEASNLELGLSTAYGKNEFGEDFATRLIGVDATFRYRPLRRAIYSRVLLRSELMWSRQDFGGDTSASSFGAYVNADYQFARRWFAGGRFDYSERAFDSSLKDKGGSAILTFWPSEFSQVRTQYRRIRYAEGVTANELLFQFLFSIGAHGAHVF